MKTEKTDLIFEGFKKELTELIDKYKRRGIITAKANSKDMAFLLTKNIKNML